MKLLAFILSFCYFSGLAQHSSQLGRFAIDYERGCAPVTVEIIVQDTFGNISRQYEYERGLAETTNTTYTYDVPGAYEIIQYLGEDVSPKSDTLTFTVVESPQPDFLVFQCNDHEVSIEVTDDSYDYYSVKFTSTDSAIYYPGDAMPAYDYESSSGTVSVTGYLTNAFPTCAERSTSFTLAAFEPTQIDSFTLREGCVDSLYIQLQGQSFQPSYQYRIEYSTDMSNYSQAYLGQILNQSPFYSISNIGLTDSLCIRVSTLNACDQTSIYNTIICRPIEQPTSLSAAYASYSGNDIKLTIGQIYGIVQVERKSGNASYQDLVEITSDFIDETPSRFRKTYYRLTQIDTCGFISPSIEINAAFLDIRDKVVKENVIEIDLSPPTNQLGSSTESLLIYNPDSTVWQTISYTNRFELPNGLGEQLLIRAAYYYSEDSIYSYSNAIQTAYESIVYVPTAFTPDGDGLNDQLELFGLPSEDFEFFIYDRWGKVIHQSAENPVWDGQIGQELTDQGGYLYRLMFRLETGELKTQVGTFTLIRK